MKATRASTLPSVIIVILAAIILTSAFYILSDDWSLTGSVVKDAGSGDQQAAPVTREKPQENTCDCTDDFNPVCANGQLYQNACTAECLGIKSYIDGECHNPNGKYMYDCGPTSGGLSAQYNPVCAKLYRLDKGDYIWRSFTNAYTACQAGRSEKTDVEGFTRGECGN